MESQLPAPVAHHSASMKPRMRHQPSSALIRTASPSPHARLAWQNGQISICSPHGSSFQFMTQYSGFSMWFIHLPVLRQVGVCPEFPPESGVLVEAASIFETFVPALLGYPILSGTQINRIVSCLLQICSRYSLCASGLTHSIRPVFTSISIYRHVFSSE